MKAKFNHIQAKWVCAVALGIGSCSHPAAAATFSDANWISLGATDPNAPYHFVYALAVSSGDLYVGGETPLSKWNGSNWSPVGGGLNSAVGALAISGGDLFVAGKFNTAINSDGTTVTVNGVAKWNGSSWSALGSGMSGSPPTLYRFVLALGLSGSDLYAGGYFTRAGGIAANNIAKWNGSGWSAVGLGLDSPVGELVVSGNDVYVGGDFIRATNSGGVAVTVNHIAKWNGITWSALGSGMHDSVRALAVSAEAVYAGGAFTNVGGAGIKCVAKWNGSNWSALGLGIGNGDSVYAPYVNALALSGSELYAAAHFREQPTLMAQQSRSIILPNGTEPTGWTWVRG